MFRFIDIQLSDMRTAGFIYSIWEHIQFMAGDEQWLVVDKFLERAKQDYILLLVMLTVNFMH